MAELSRFIAAAFERVGLPPDDAAEVAELMTETDLTGADAHGVFRLPQYVRRIQAGGVNPKPNIEVRQTGPATALVDGDNGMGHLVMARAADEAVALARETGVAWVGVRRSNHAGSAGLYAEMPVKHGMVGIYSAVASANHMAPWGGSDSLLGTNPLATASRSPIRAARTKACCCRSAATRAAASPWCSACSAARSTGPPSAAM